MSWQICMYVCMCMCVSFCSHDPYVTTNHCVLLYSTLTGISLHKFMATASGRIFLYVLCAHQSVNQWWPHLIGDHSISGHDGLIAPQLLLFLPSFCLVFLLLLLAGEGKRQRVGRRMYGGWEVGGMEVEGGRVGGGGRESEWSGRMRMDKKWQETSVWEMGRQREWKEKWGRY